MYFHKHLIFKFVYLTTLLFLDTPLTIANVIAYKIKACYSLQLKEYFGLVIKACYC